MKGKKIAEFHNWYVETGNSDNLWDAAAGIYRTRAEARRKAAEFLPPLRPAVHRVTVQIFIEHKRAK